MGKFNREGSGGFSNNRGSHFGDRPKFGGGNRGGDRGGDRPQMFSATCSDCGRPCEVPFRPTNGKPVFCKECFGGKENTRERDSFPRKEFKKEFRNDWKPSNSNSQGESNGGNDELKKQLEIVNVKLDRLIRSIDALTATKETPVASAPKVEAPKVESLKSIVNKVIESKPEKKIVAKAASKKTSSKSKK